MRFEFSTAPQIVFGPGTLREAGKLARPLGSRALVVTGGNPARAEPLLALLRAGGLSVETFPVAHEPSVQVVAAGLAAARGFRAELVVGFGGGSVIDAAKAIAGLYTNPGDALDYLEVVGAGRPLSQPALPWIAIPTTAGTGAEVTRNAVLSVSERKVKVSLRSPFLLPRIALVDPETTYDLPAAITAASGMDALTQLIEAYTCNRTNPMIDALCAAGIPRAAKALSALAGTPRNTAARDDLSLAALWSGIALANAGLGAVHGFAGPIGGLFTAPHGAVCAALLAPVMRANLAALQAREPGHASVGRYEEIARWLTGRPDAGAADGIDCIGSLVSKLRIQPLSAFGLTQAGVPGAVVQAQKASSMKANPIVLTEAELTVALTEAL